MKRVLATILGVWSSRKLWMTVFGLCVIWLSYWPSVALLYSFTEPEQTTALVSMYRDMMLAVTAIVLGYLGIQGVVQWRHGTTSAVQQIAESIHEKREEKVEVSERIVHEMADRYRDDESYRPIVPDTEEPFR